MASVFLRAFVTCACLCLLHSAPLEKRMIDLTYMFDETTLEFPEIKEFQLEVVMNGTFADGIWLQSEEYSSSTHAGTHMDAPIHFVPDGIAIDALPVEHFIAPVAVLDITEQAARDKDYEATVTDLLTWESTTGQTLNGTVLLLRTGWGRKWHDRAEYYGTPERDPEKLRFPGLSPEAAQWLVDNRNIYGIGLDTLSIDRGLSKTFDSHKILLEREIYILENVANLETLPLYGATIYVMPTKIGGASGAPTRIIATYPVVTFHSNTLGK